MWGVFNVENRLIKSFTTKGEAEKYAGKCNLTWQSCGFHIREVNNLA
jgi:hypothetical protein